MYPKLFYQHPQVVLRLLLSIGVSRWVATSQLTINLVFSCKIMDFLAYSTGLEVNAFIQCVGCTSMWNFFYPRRKMHPLHPLYVIRCPNIMNSHISDSWLWYDGGHLIILCILSVRETWGDGRCLQMNIMSIHLSTAPLYIMYYSINVLHFFLHKEKFLLWLTCHS